MPTLLSLQVGLPQRRAMPQGVRVDFQHPSWTSGIFKEPIPGPVLITPSGIPGDGQSDVDNHGGPDNVILAYNAALYPHWRQTLNQPDLPFGAFGENFTVDGFTDETVCIGDIWQVNAPTTPTRPPEQARPEHSLQAAVLTLQVTQPRQPCFKLARRLQCADIVKLVRQGRNGGWYLRVLTPGPAAPGMTITRTANPHPDWPVAKAVEIMYTRALNPHLAASLAALPELSTRWHNELNEP